MIVSIVLGAFTHVVWDTFTHANRLGSQWVPALNTTLGPLPVFKWLQTAAVCSAWPGSPAT